MTKLNKGIKVFNEFYPFYLILLVFAPIIIGFIIDYDLSDSRYFIINLLWIPIFTLPAILLKNRTPYIIASIIYFIFGIIEISHWVIVKGPLTITSILVLSNTNSQEALEFISLKASAGLLLLLGYVLLFILSLRYIPKYETTKPSLIAIVVVVLISTFFISENAFQKRLIRKGVPQIAKVAFSYLEQRELYNAVKQDVVVRKLDAEATLIANKQVFVLIIGESCNRKHMSIYGASRQTTPKLGNRDDLYVFTDVVSPYSNTISSVLSILSESNLENNKSFKNSIDIFDVFSSAGFKTFWLSNQPPIGIWENMVTIFAKKADHCEFVNVTSNSSFEAILSTSYDSKLFDPFAKALQDTANKKLIILHLMGSHSAYAKRYPSEYNIFQGANTKEELIAEFDNSILYNDFIVDSLFTLLSTANKLEDKQYFLAIYLSDHGENVYDELDRVGHDYSKSLPKANVEIPFILWLPQNYAGLYSCRIIAIDSNINKPFVSDDLFHSIIDLNSIETSYFQNQRSIFNINFNDSRKRVLEDDQDYDKE